MDDSLAIVSNLENGNDSHHIEQLLVAKETHTCALSGLDTVHELGNVFHGTLQMKDEDFGTSIDLPSDNDFDEEVPADDSDIYLYGSIETSSKCLLKCATFPVAASAEEKTPDLQSESNSYTRSLSLPNTCKLVSAVKGSREKEGMPARNLNVSWAPDVYDPPPSNFSIIPKKKLLEQSKSNKKHGKGKQKGKSMRVGGSGPKDKKHYRKIGGNSNRCLDSYADTDRVVSSSKNKSAAELLDFDDDDYDDDD